MKNSLLQRARIVFLFASSQKKIFSYYEFTIILYFANDILHAANNENLTEQRWQQLQPRLLDALRRFPTACASPAREVVVGGDATHWKVSNPEVFQQRI